MPYRLCLFVLAAMMLVSCGKKRKKMAGEDQVNMQEFVDFFPEVSLPFIYADTALYAKTDDSLLISADIFNEFTPDSILQATFDNEKPKLYAVGKFTEKNGTIYLLSKAATAKQKMLFISAYSNKNEFIAALPVMK